MINTRRRVLVNERCDKLGTKAMLNCSTFNWHTDIHAKVKGKYGCDVVVSQRRAPDYALRSA